MWEGFAGAALGSVANVGMGLYSAHQSAKEARAADKRAWRYYKKQRALDYQYDANQYFDLDTKRLNTDNQINYELAKRYAENSAKWTVAGLRNARLNPILAATDGNFRGTFGEGSTAQASRSSGSMPSGHQGDVPTVDVAGAASKLGDSLQGFGLTDEQTKGAKISNDVADETKDAQVADAYNQAQKTAYESDLAKARIVESESNTARNMAEASKALNSRDLERARLGEKSPFGLVALVGDQLNRMFGHGRYAHSAKDAELLQTKKDDALKNLNEKPVSSSSHSHTSKRKGHSFMGRKHKFIRKRK